MKDLDRELYVYHGLKIGSIVCVMHKSHVYVTRIQKVLDSANISQPSSGKIFVEVYVYLENFLTITAASSLRVYSPKQIEAYKQANKNIVWLTEKPDKVINKGEL